MEFNVTIQGTFYKTVDAVNTGSAVFIAALDIANGVVPGFNPNEPHNIVITPVPPDPFEKWATVAPQNPVRFDVWLAPDDTEWIYDQPRGTNGRYIADDPNTPKQESALRWQPHTQFNVDAA